MTVKQNCYKLAQLIKIAAKDIVNDNINTYCSIHCMFGDCSMDRCYECSAVLETAALEVKNNFGYRSIIIGDVRGNKGYALIYSEESVVRDGKEKWKYRCFPPTKDIAMMLEKLYNGDYCDRIVYHEGSGGHLSECMAYLSKITKGYIDKINADKRTAQEMYDKEYFI